ncbi:MAG: pyridoxal phosphate-dependent aminotransferase [Alkalispirochaeta sp.]
MSELNALERARIRIIRDRGREAVIDLCNSSFRVAGITPSEEIYRLAWEMWRRNPEYIPSGRGGEDIRRRVAEFYRERGVGVEVDQVVVTAGSSVSYHLVFSILRGEGAGRPAGVALPLPGYPLFEDIARDAGVEMIPYYCAPHAGFLPDPGEIEDALRSGARGVVVISPNNPTGIVVPEGILSEIAGMCSRYGAVLIIDEVFAEFVGDGGARPSGGDDPGGVPLLPSVAEGGCIVLRLHGLSKLAAAPEVKLGWIAVTGSDPRERSRWSDALDRHHDTYLTVSGYAEAFGRAVLGTSAGHRGIAVVREGVLNGQVELDRWVRDAPYLEDLAAGSVRGGIHRVLRIEQTVVAARIGSLDDEQIAVSILERAGILVHPGYLYGMEGEPFGLGPWFVVTALHQSGTVSIVADRLHDLFG